MGLIICSYFQFIIKYILFKKKKITILKKTHIFYYIIIFLIFLAHCGAGRTCYSDIESFIMAEINVFDCHLYVQSLLMARSDIARTSTATREGDGGYVRVHLSMGIF